ncbi:putative protein LZIC [Monocercomonoides exilis]|uniref:putative protein LZIC n=1 Tax=Monocercomonoides exilis TaxID=2049356 RepID=UPI00355AAD23|nr:putative protein LZIC [Monocercomonoides exilis]|eukprot:MONOS_9564.1-p1 / transcript=MONOS_9564.1 / gene=MONOS_9564 / organism=Monocercomonoides_exilis_PA203 / gene_product=Protein LZIC / transcript_product=Protein LZIC / location=Mono_scaffold00399:49337-50207(+) / protein_length=187 / sequence_SO=supercontig / SO=protein_coding / is_pseudo=false
MSLTDQKLKENIQSQLGRLTNQLSDLDEMKDDMEPDEYESMKEDTMQQFKEFSDSLTKMAEGDMTLIDELSSMRLAIQAAISAAFKTPEVIRLFAKREPAQLRQHLEQHKRDFHLQKISEDVYNARAVEILVALKGLGEALTPAEEELLSKHGSDSMAQFAVATDKLGEGAVLKAAGSQVRSAQKKE